MTLFSASHATKVLALAVALAASGMTAASAGGGFEAGWSSGDMDSRTIIRRDRHVREGWHERRDHEWRRAKRDWRRAERHRERHWRRDRNFYGGAVAAYDDPGNGIYFYLDEGSLSETFATPLRRSRGPKIIHVMPGQNDCSWEAGVCVVRP